MCENKPVVFLSVDFITKPNILSQLFKNWTSLEFLWIKHEFPLLLDTVFADVLFQWEKKQKKQDI